MIVSIENTIVFQLVDNKLKYGYFKSKTNQIVWQNIETKNISISKIIIDMNLEYKNIIIIPDTKLMDACVSNKTVILVTKGLKKLIQLIYPKLNNSIWEIEEKVSLNGNIALKLSEPEINKALRFVFTTKPETTIISLNNSIFNPLHEKTLHNLLKSIGYKPQVSMLND